MHHTHDIAALGLPTPARRQSSTTSWHLARLTGLAVTAGLLSALLVADSSLSLAARGAMAVFVLSLCAWSVLRWPDAPVALAGALMLCAIGAITPAAFYAGLGHSIIWLMIGAFVLAAALRQTGLADLIAARAVARASTVAGLFHRLTLLIALTAFAIPSTSGRAALLFPVFGAIATCINERRIVTALALLFPTIILLSACASLTGAGAHLVAIEYMRGANLPAPGFLHWAVLGAPFALLSCWAATWVILRTFLTREERTRSLSLRLPEPVAHAGRRYVLCVSAACIALWASAGWHDLEITMIALLAAIAVTQQRWSGVSFKDAMKGVEWNLIVFLAATTVMGQALLSTGAAQWLAQAKVALFPAAWLHLPAVPLIVVIVAALVSHLFITSRTARATVLVPTLALPLAMQPEQAGLLIFVATLASGYCQTFKVSAKPVALFSQGDVSYGERELTRLSLRLLPVMVLQLLLFSLLIWPRLGL